MHACILFLVTTVKMEDDLSKISQALKTMEDNNPSRSFGNPADVMDFLINAVDITFMAKCSAYEQYIEGNFSK